MNSESLVPGPIVLEKSSMLNTPPWMHGPHGAMHLLGGYHEDLLNLQVDETFDVDWGDYSSTHEYTSELIEGKDAVVNFRVFDGDVLTNTPYSGWYGDNQGFLYVDIYAQL
jgi:hypothetical protein